MVNLLATAVKQRVRLQGALSDCEPHIGQKQLPTRRLSVLLYLNAPFVHPRGSSVVNVVSSDALVCLRVGSISGQHAPTMART